VKATIPTTTCKRCGATCRADGIGNPNARMMRRAKKGYCPECFIVQWLQRMSNMDGGRLLSGMPGEATPQVLRLPYVQRLLLRTMRAGLADAAPSEINWERVIEVWCIAPRESGMLF